LPIQLPGPASWEREALRDVGPAGMGVFELGVFKPPDA
jgi:hypothetical protein